jgi:hypothetical protein
MGNFKLSLKKAQKAQKESEGGRWTKGPIGSTFRRA